MAIGISIVPAWAGPAEAPEAKVATEQLAGTFLIMVPQIDYERAVLRVAGPEGYALTKRLVYGSPLRVDLLADREPLSRDRAQIAGRDVDPETLRDGKYNYELVLFDELGQRHVQSGSFSVAGGMPVAREARQRQVLADEPSMTAERAEQKTSLAPRSHGVTGDFDNFVSIRNVSGRGLSRLNFNTTDSLVTNVDSWRLANNADTNNFEIIEGGGTTTRLVMRQGGNLGLGTETPLAKLHVIGGGIIEGDVALGSSRTIKHEIEPLDGGEILDAVRSLPLYSWKYKDDPLQASHVGPMAEDVHAAFSLGRDEKHLSPADSAGLALAAIQGIDVAVSEFRASNVELAAENRDLRERLATIEARLGDLLAAVEPAAE